jgi:predicted Abi (CAAX) family protease
MNTLMNLLAYRLTAAGLLLLYAAVYLPIGLKSGFLKLEVQSSWQTVIAVIVGAFLSPGLLEELIFRVLLIPHPTEDRAIAVRFLFAGGSCLAFIAYHPLNIAAPSFFSDPTFLLGAGLLGIVCTFSYLQSGSLWPPVVIHWLIVVVWLLLLGGIRRFK